MITNQQLRETFLSPNLQYYLHRKLAPAAPEEIDARTEELLKYLNISVFCNGDIPFSLAVDEVWHYWIMETKEYFALCEKLHGRGYIHHSSNDYQEFTHKDVKSKKPDFDRIINILVTYVHNYGPFTADRIQYWPFAERIMEGFDWNLTQLNDWLLRLLNEKSVVHA
jgi:hypothetical protein